MERKIFIFFIVAAALFLSGCAKKDYEVRFTNNFKETINNVTIGTAQFGSVATGQTTDYKRINTKSFLISGTSTSYKQLNSSEAVSGKGKHKWTVTLNAAGGIDFKEDPA